MSSEQSPIITPKYYAIELPPRSRVGVVPVPEVKKMIRSGGAAAVDEVFPAVFVGRKSSAALNGHNGEGVRGEEIDKLKKFLQEKGL